MKTRNLCVILLFLVVLASCSDDFLTQINPNNASSANFWKTETDLNAAVATLYVPMTGYYGGMYGAQAYSEDIGFRTDQFFYYNTDITIEGFLNDASSKISAELWKGNYKGIFYANQVIKYGGDMVLSNNNLNKYVGEAYFMRGLYYFNLVNEWGSVPIFKKLQETPNEFYKPRSNIDSVWMQVVNDFSEAAIRLPKTRLLNTEAGRATKGAALAFLGRAYLYQKKYDKAIEVLQEIVDRNNYNLLKDYSQLFDGQHENNVESIFEIQYAYIPGDSSHTSMLGKFYAPLEANGWDAARQKNPSILETFLEEKTIDGKIDPRATASLAWNYPGCIFFKRQFNTSFDTTITYVKKYTHWWLSEEIDENIGSELNLIVMRYADVLLMLAEAYANKNNMNKAAHYVQLIRSRANLSDNTVKMEAYTLSKMMEEIQHQRVIELFMEGTHFFDLRRWGMLRDAIMNSPNKFKNNYSEKYNYYPIPQEELDMNPYMIQNELW